MKALGIARASGLAGVRQPAGLSLAAGALGGVRDRPVGDRPGARAADLEPARGRASVRQVPPRPGAAGGLAPRRANGANRRSTTRSGSTTRSRRWSRSPRRTASRPRAGGARLAPRAGPASRRVIVGARTDEQLADNLAAANLELSADEHARLEQVSRPPLPYPFWHQALPPPSASAPPTCRCSPST